MSVMSMNDELVELGLAPAPRSRCEHVIARTGRNCRQEAALGTDRCLFHGGAALACIREAAPVRQQMTNELLPVAVRRLYEVLCDDSANLDTVVRAAFGIMDRVGLGPVQGIQLDARVETRAPLELLQSMLTQVAERLTPPADVVDAEVVPDSVEIDGGATGA